VGGVGGCWWWVNLGCMGGWAGGGVWVGGRGWWEGGGVGEGGGGGGVKEEGMVGTERGERRAEV